MILIKLEMRLPDLESLFGSGEADQTVDILISEALELEKDLQDVNPPTDVESRISRMFTGYFDDFVLTSQSLTREVFLQQVDRRRGELTRLRATAELPDGSALP